MRAKAAIGFPFPVPAPLLLLLMISSSVIFASSRQKSHKSHDYKFQVNSDGEIPLINFSSSVTRRSEQSSSSGNGIQMWDDRLEKVLSRRHQLLSDYPEVEKTLKSSKLRRRIVHSVSSLEKNEAEMEVQRMKKRSANYSGSNSTNDFNAEKISSTMPAQMPSAGNGGSHTTAQTNLTKSSPLPPSPDVQKPKIDIEQIANYKEFLSDYESWAGEEKAAAVCRHYGYLPKRLFALNSCAQCYNYVRDTPGLFGNPSKKWGMTATEWIVPNKAKTFTISVLVSKNSNLTVFANASGPESALLSSFANEDARRKWLACCHAAENCCERIQTTLPISSPSATGENSCVPTWDGWQCWSEAKPSITVREPCPHYIYFSMTEAPSCTEYAEKTCGHSGRWQSRLNSRLRAEIEWTNYGNCGSGVINTLKRRTYVHVIAYMFSIVAIIPALAVFFAYKQLRVHRIILHRNLFISMLANGVVVICLKTFVILNELQNDSLPNSIINQNGVGCRLLFILTKYSRLTNYMWMFCEGYYLHKLIAAAFAEQKSLIVFYLIGWVFPLVPTLTYAIIRMSNDELNDRCWVVPEESIEWIFNGPSLLSLLINMLFLINIVRVLITKLRATHADEPSQYRKAVRATLVLLPLFGLHFVITIYRPAPGAGTCEWLEIYYHINDILDGIQGFLVALIFCYLNGEVINLLKRTYGRWKEQHGCSMDGCRRQSSGARLKSRQSRGGSMMGRSVVSTQCYSLPPSPEIQCTNSNNAPTTMRSNHLTAGDGIETINLNNFEIMNYSSGATDGGSGGGDRKKSETNLNGLGKNNTGAALPINAGNHLNSIVKIKNNDNEVRGVWTEVRLDDACSNSNANNATGGNKQNKNGTPVKSGIIGEHQL